MSDQSQPALKMAAEPPADASSQTPLAPRPGGESTAHDSQALGTPVGSLPHTGGAPGTLPAGEQIPRLTRPAGAPARSIPEWDLEPPAFLIKRGESA
jgi:hypothetical protein